MKTLKLKFTTGAMLILLLFGFGIKQGYSQFLGLSSYLYNDSIAGANHCLNDTVEGSIYWYQAGTYTPGDFVDFNVEWGDGANSSFPNTPIIIGAGYGYIDPVINFSHLYTVAGNYTIIVTSADNHSNTDADTFHLNVNNLCGNIYTTVYLDNGDAVYGVGDILMPGVDLQLTSAGPSYYGNTGAYGFSTISNIDINQPSYTLEVSPSWLTSTGMTLINPVGGSYNVTGVNATPQNFMFLLDCGVATYYDASIYGYGWGFRAGMSTGYATLYINNSSCNGGAAATDISLDFDPMLTVFSSSLAGATISAGNISWTGASIPFGPSSIQVFFTVPGGTPALTPLDFEANISSTSATDVNPSNNISIFHSEVRNSWDPNDKSTNLEQAIDVNAQEEIVYTIRFQNMGNDDAFNIHIKDTISSLLDLSTLKVISQSHAGSYSVDATTREVIFNFPNIYLVPQSMSESLSQGYIMYAIKENAGLGLNSEIENTAHIFFDENAAVVTNTASNVNVMNPAGIETSNPLNSMVVYPTPADHLVYISGVDVEDIITIKIYDLHGKIQQVLNAGNINSTIDVTTFANGIYLMEIQTNDHSVTRKICIQH